MTATSRFPDRAGIWLSVMLCCSLAAALGAAEERRNSAPNQSGPVPAEHRSGNSEHVPSSESHPQKVGKLPDFEAALHGFPAFLDRQGTKLGDGEFLQWVEGQQLHVRITYDFGAGRLVEEQATFRQDPEFIQDSWSWKEIRSNHLYRQFTVDLGSGRAAGQKAEGSGFKKWARDLKIEPGCTFAGFGFTLALKGLRDGLLNGQKIELLAVIFTPKPRLLPVEVSYGGRDQMLMAGRKVPGDRFIIHPKVPLVAKAFVEVNDERIWLTLPRPAGFLRWEGPIVEPDDPIVRVDLLPGEHSGPAEPNGASAR